MGCAYAPPLDTGAHQVVPVFVNVRLDEERLADDAFNGVAASLRFSMITVAGRSVIEMDVARLWSLGQSNLLPEGLCQLIPGAKTGEMLG